VGGQQVEVLGVERRRRWSEEAKAAIVAEALRPGASVSLVARRHGLHPNQVFTWRRALSERRAPAARGSFAAVRVLEPARPGGSGVIEIELAGGDRLRVDGAVDAEALRRVIGVLEARR
jgi:transposase